MTPINTWLTPEEVALFTDVRTGKGGKTREQLQIEALKAMKVPYFVSAIGRPKVARAVVEGHSTLHTHPADQQAAWQPGLSA